MRLRPVRRLFRTFATPRFLGIPIAAGVASCTLASSAKSPHSGYEEITCGSVHPGSVRTGTAEVYVGNHGWHTGVLLRSEDAGPVLGDLVRELSAAPWIEIGWGDRDYYMSSGYSVSAGLGAILWTNKSVLHVAGISPSPAAFYATGGELVRLTVPLERLPSLLGYIRDWFELNEQGESERLGPGLYGSPNGFYAAKGTFSLFHTCNTWTGKAVAAAGCAIDTGITRASSLMDELRSLGPHR